MMMMLVGGFCGVLHRTSDMEHLFREYSTDMVRVWPPVDLRSLLLPLSVAEKAAVEFYPSVNRRQLWQESAQLCQTGKRTVRYGVTLNIASDYRTNRHIGPLTLTLSS